MFKKFLAVMTFFILMYVWVRGKAGGNVYCYDRVMTEEDNVAATVRIRSISRRETRSGSGVVWDITEDGKLIILTAKHCVDDYRTEITELVFDNGETCFVYDFYLCPEDDIAFIQVDCSQISEETLKSLKEVRYDECIKDQRGEKTYTIGKHYQDGVVYYEGRCATSALERFAQKITEKSCFVSHCTVVPGTSGGGIYNEAGYLIGITSKGMEGITTYEGIQYIIDYAKRAFEDGEGYGRVDIDSFR